MFFDTPPNLDPEPEMCIHQHLHGWAYTYLAEHVGSSTCSNPLLLEDPFHMQHLNVSRPHFTMKTCLLGD